MRYLVSGKEMKAIDRRSIETFGIPSLVLMERAALSVAVEAKTLLAGKPGNVWAVCGPGNNGADGVAAARMLFLSGITVSILLPDRNAKLSPEMETQLSIAEKLEIPVYSYRDFIPGSCALVIDALFGIGLTRPLEGVYRELAGLIQGQKDEYGAKVLSLIHI